MKALSVRQPWAWAIFNAGKHIENRSWATSHRGSLLIHTGIKLDKNAMHLGLFACPGYNQKMVATLPRGGIIGMVDLVDCVRRHTSIWAEPGCWHWVLANPRPLDFILLKGKLGIFEIPNSLIKF